MRAPKKATEEQGQKVPGYIVTYSDMVTLLLTFFVMLLTLADVQDPELFDKGRDSFLQSIRYVGLGILFGRQTSPDLGNHKTKYFIDSPDETTNQRTLDAKKEQLRRILENIKSKTTTMDPEITAEKNNFSVTNIHFQPGQASLDDSAKQYLSTFCADLQQSTGREPISLYVLGLAPEENTDREQWLLSAMRAEIAAKYLRNIISNTFNSQKNTGILDPLSEWSVYSWGAGAGGDWTNSDSPVSERTHILIAILR